ncbi:MAG: hypothetical protein HY722_02790 [Planctomycetes bacterium]|nr:hypothetical protein [Planctomycetota bacterium]
MTLGTRLRRPRSRTLTLVLLALAILAPPPAPLVAQEEAGGACKLTNLYYIFSNGRVYAFIRNDIPDKVVVKAKLKVGWVDKGGAYLGNKFLHVDDMWLPSHKSGIFFWVVEEFRDQDVGGVRLEGFWVWYKKPEE